MYIYIYVVGVYASSISKCTSSPCCSGVCQRQTSLYCVSSLRSLSILPMAQLQIEPHSSVMDNSQRNKKMNIAPKRPVAFKISENGLWYFFFKTKFYLSMTTGWKVTKNQNDTTTEFRRFSIETFIQIHSFEDAWSLQNSVVPSLWSCSNLTFILRNFSTSRGRY